MSFSVPPFGSHMVLMFFPECDFVEVVEAKRIEDFDVANFNFSRVAPPLSLQLPSVRKMSGINSHAHAP